MQSLHTPLQWGILIYFGVCMKNFRKVASALVLCAASLSSHASFVANGEIESIYDSGNKIGSSVDQWFFTVGSDSEVSIDVLSWEADEEGIASDDGFPEAVDLNNDGEFSFIDSFIYLFLDDGDLGVDDLIAFNDDSSNTYGDGSLSYFDSFLVADLFAGNYVLAIGSALSVEEAVAGISNTVDFPASCDVDPFFGCFLQSSDRGDYQVSFNGDVFEKNVEVPEPWALGLFGMGLLFLVQRRQM